MATMDQDKAGNDWQGLLQEWGARLLLFARQQAADPVEAEDIVQEAFVRYWKSRLDRPDLSPPLLFTFVRRIATDRARQWRRRQTGLDALRIEVANGDGWFEPVIEDRERAALLETALRSLPVEQREVLVLKIWAGLTFDEIGTTLEISPHTAASRYRYGLGQLRRQLTPVLT